MECPHFYYEFLLLPGEGYYLSMKSIPPIKRVEGLFES